MRYFTNKGVLEKVDDYTYKIPTRRMTIESSEVEEYCPSGSNWYICDGKEEFEQFDTEQLLVLTIKYFISGVEEEFQYVNKDGKEVGHPIAGYDEKPEFEPEPEPVEEIEPDVEEEIEAELEEENAEEIKEEFLNVLDMTTLHSIQDGKEWLDRLRQIYQRADGNEELQEDLDYTIQERKKLYQRYVDNMNPKTEKQIQAIKAQSEGMRGEHIRELANELVESRKKLDQVKGLENRLDKEAEWLEKFDKYKEELDEYNRWYYEAIGNCLAGESSQVLLGYMLNEWDEAR